MEKETVTRAYLMNVIYKKLGYSRAESADLVDTVIDQLSEGLIEDGEAKISSFGTFKIRQKKERIGRNPKTKEEVAISPRRVVSFYASNVLKKLINKKVA